MTNPVNPSPVAMETLPTDVRVKTHGGPERQSIFLLIENVQRADFGLHTISHGGDDTVQGFLDIVGVADEGADILKDRKVRLCFSHGSDLSCHENVDGTEPKYYSIKHKFEIFARDGK